MARSATTSGRRPRQDARRQQQQPSRSRYGQGVAGRPLFFEKIRRRTKWVFVVLAIVFALAFVGAGVGSGSSGLGDLLQGNFTGLFGGGGGASVKSAEKQIEKHPNDPAGYKKLSQAYQNKSDNDAAIPPLEHYTSMRPKDVDALTTLANLYQDRVSRLQQYGYSLQQDATTAQQPAALALDPSSPLAQALSQDEITSALQSTSQQRQDAVQTALSVAQNGWVGAWKQIVADQPDDPGNLQELALAAQQAGDTTTEISAYRRFLKVAPDDPSAPDIRKQLKQLTQPPAPAKATPKAAAGG